MNKSTSDLLPDVSSLSSYRPALNELIRIKIDPVKAKLLLSGCTELSDLQAKLTTIGKVLGQASSKIVSAYYTELKDLDSSTNHLSDEVFRSSTTERTEIDTMGIPTLLPDKSNITPEIGSQQTLSAAPTDSTNTAMELSELLDEWSNKLLAWSELAKESNISDQAVMASKRQILRSQALRVLPVANDLVIRASQVADHARVEQMQL